MTIKENKYLNLLLLFSVILFGVLALFLFITTVNALREGSYMSTGHTVEVWGEGEAYTSPDLAVINFSVINEAKEADEALSENAEKTNKVIEYLKSEEIEEKNIKTTTFNILPRYEYQAEKIEEGRYSEGKRVLVGYEVTQNIELKLRDMEKIGAVIEGAVSVGANRVNNMSFTVENVEELEREARQRAIEMAKKEAENIEEQLGVSLGRVIGFNEQKDVPDVIMRDYAESLKYNEESVPPEIATGENKISSRVKIIYEIR